MLRLFLLALLALPLAAAELLVMTFTVRYPNPGDGEDFWEKRKDLFIETVRRHKPDPMGAQELFCAQGEYTPGSFAIGPCEWPAKDFRFSGELLPLAGKGLHLALRIGAGLACNERVYEEKAKDRPFLLKHLRIEAEQPVDGDRDDPKYQARHRLSCSPDTNRLGGKLILNSGKYSFDGGSGLVAQFLCRRHFGLWLGEGKELGPRLGPGMGWTMGRWLSFSLAARMAAAS